MALGIRERQREREREREEKQREKERKKGTVYIVGVVGYVTVVIEKKGKNFAKIDIEICTQQTLVFILTKLSFAIYGTATSWDTFKITMQFFPHNLSKKFYISNFRYSIK